MLSADQNLSLCFKQCNLPVNADWQIALMKNTWLSAGTYFSTARPIDSLADQMR